MERQTKGIAVERQGQPREDVAEVGAFNSTDKAGELKSVGSLWREGKAKSSHPGEGNMSAAKKFYHIIFVKIP